MLIHSFHGLLILMIGLVGGFYQSKAIKSNNGREVAWRVVHSGGCMAGIMLIALGVVSESFFWSAYEKNAYLSSLLVGTYALIIGMVLAAMFGARGIGNEGKKNTIGKLVSILYKVGAILSFFSIAYLLFKVSLHLF